MAGESSLAPALRRELAALSDRERAAGAKRFFKVGPGQYGEGDLFWGVAVPQVRRLLKLYPLEPEEAVSLVLDPVHEVRLAGLLSWKKAWERALKMGEEERGRQIVALYWQYRTQVNSWDLVDNSASILGEYARSHPPTLLYLLAHSGKLWEERLSLVATLSLLKVGRWEETWTLARFFIDHPHDLIHKACGWMLREMGKRRPDRLEAFLELYAPQLARVALRYAIERLPAAERARWLAYKERG